MGGATALYDAIGYAIHKIDSVQRHTHRNHRAEKVMMVIITDGYENSSREYSLPRIKSMITAKEEAGWEFVFLGANIDAAEVAGEFGISADRAVDYVPDAAGTRLNFDTIAVAQMAYRTHGAVPTATFAPIREDMAARGKKHC